MFGLESLGPVKLPPAGAEVQNLGLLRVEALPGGVPMHSHCIKKIVLYIKID